MLIMSGDGEIMKSPSRCPIPSASSTSHARIDRYRKPVGSSRFPLFLDPKAASLAADAKTHPDASCKRQDEIS